MNQLTFFVKMPKNVHVTDEIKLEGFQAILEPGKFGYSLAAIVGEDVIDKLETERAEVLRWAEGKLKNLAAHVRETPLAGRTGIGHTAGGSSASDVPPPFGPPAPSSRG